MNYSDDALRDITEASEGLHLTAYPDPGTGGEPWTIGFGHTGPEIHQGMVITQDQAERYLRSDIAGAEAVVNRLVKVPLTQHQFDALVDFTFNAGQRNFAESTLLVHVNQREFVAADQEFTRWVFGGGHRLPGLVKRREAEMAWFATL